MSLGKRLISAEAPFENAFNVVTYSGNSSTQSITGVGFKPDVVWIRERGPNAENSNLYDSTRGIRYFLTTNNQSASVLGGTGRLTSFDTDGFTVGSDNEINDNGSTYVAWCWRANEGTTTSNTDGSVTSTVQANQAAGFSIVKWTGTGSNLTVGTGLTTAADLIITKAIGTVSPGVGEAWPVFHSSLTNNNIGYLDQTYAASSGNKSTVYQDPTTTSTTFKVGNWRGINQNGLDMIAYCFHSVEGYSKFGSYSGSGSSNTQSVNTGFQPDWVMIKDYSAGGSWWIQDSVRGSTKSLKANATSAESTTNYVTGFTSTGFNVTSGLNDNSVNSQFIYMAFKIVS